MKNWAGNLEYSASGIAHPTTIDALRDVITGSGPVKALGSRHSFNNAADTTGTLIALDRMAVPIELDTAACTVRVGAGCTYAQLSEFLEAKEFALHNLASLPHISVAGAVQTGTHGSGVLQGSLASAVMAFDIVRASGEAQSLRASDPDFDASVVGIGALGIVTALTLRVEPSYQVAQHVHEGLPWAVALDNWWAIMGSAYSVSVFTTFHGENTHQIWSKRRVGQDVPELDLAALGAVESLVPLHPLPGVEADSVTDQLRSPGPWHERLPHFRSDFQPSHGNEIQSEYLIPAVHAVAAIEALRAIGTLIAPLLYVSELRSVAADAAWLSPSHQRDSLAIHFTWLQRPEEILAVLPRIEEVLAPYEARPHWGKVSTMTRADLHRVYPRLDDFAGLAERVDPAGRLHNAFLERVLFDD